jgi:hypothetical protein
MAAAAKTARTVLRLMRFLLGCPASLADARFLFFADPGGGHDSSGEGAKPAMPRNARE